MKIFQLTGGEPVAIKGILRKKLFILFEGDLAFREIPFITSETALKYHATDVNEQGELQEVGSE